MNKPAFKVTIPEPCHENWNAMTPREQGRFCSVCTKTVVDFSAMTDTQLFDLLKNGSGSMCGHFHKDQLERTITAPKKPKWFLQPFWKYFVGLILFFKAPAAKAQGKPVCTPVPQNIPQRTVGIIAVNPQQKAEKEVTGKIVNSSNMPVGGAIINIKGTTKYTTADTKGSFKIKARDGDMLEVTDLEYDAATYRVASENNITITLKQPERQYFLGEMAVVQHPVQNAELVINVTDKITGKPLSAAMVSWTELNPGNPSRNEQVNAKGTVKTKVLLNQPEINFSVHAGGYATNSVKFSTTGFSGKKAVVLNVELEKERMASSIEEPVLDNGLKGSLTSNIIPPAPGLQLQGRLGGLQLQAVTINEEVKTILPIKKTSFKIFPNPLLKNEPFTLEFLHYKTETVMAQVIDAEGKIILNHRFEAVKGLNREQILLPPNINRGAVMVKLMNSKGQWMEAERVVVE